MRAIITHTGERSRIKRSGSTIDWAAAIKNGEFKAISFDNIGLGQLSPGRFMTKEEWEEFYMGDDGRNGSFNSASMYIDAVDGKFAYNSCCPMRYDNTCLSLTDCYGIRRRVCCDTYDGDEVSGRY